MAALDPLLDALGEDELPQRGGGQSIAKLSYTHQDMVDFIIANPTASQGEIAARYGYRPHWVSIIISSDAFKEALAARRAEVKNPILTASVESMMKGLAHRSLEVLMEKLSGPAAAIPDQLAMQAAALGAKSLGMGLPQNQVAAGPVTNLDALAERLATINRRNRHAGVIDVEVHEVPRRPEAAHSGHPDPAA